MDLRVLTHKALQIKGYIRYRKAFEDSQSPNKPKKKHFTGFIAMIELRVQQKWGKKKKQRKPIKKRYSNACTELLFAYCAQDPFVAREYFPRKQTLSVETNRTEKYMGKASNKSSGFDF